MKKLIALTIMAFVIMTNHSFAQTDTNSLSVDGIKASVKQAAETNLNQVFVEMLSGVKDASGDMYKFSKNQLGQAYDEVKQQTPEVITEFLKWQIAKAIGYIIIWLLVAIVAFYISYRLGVSEKNSSYSADDYCSVKWIARIIGFALVIISLGINGMTIAKVAIAPRVFIIEYVIDLYHDKTDNYR